METAGPSLAEHQALHAEFRAEQKRTGGALNVFSQTIQHYGQTMTNLQTKLAEVEAVGKKRDDEISELQRQVRSLTSEVEQLKGAQQNQRVVVRPGLMKIAKRVLMPKEWRGVTDLILLEAAMRGKLDVVQDALDEGANVNSKDSCGMTALHFAARGGYLYIVKALLQRRANINCQTINSETPLVMAAFHGHSSVVEVLLIAGADYSLRDNNGKTALMWATEKNLSSTINVLNNAGA